MPRIRYTLLGVSPGSAGAGLARFALEGAEQTLIFSNFFCLRAIRQ